ncbi:MAG: protein-glutamate O-methyltransferase CheR [Actinobacteria bacterium]|nr:protein-glutamate O-methyltransferase CheR [Actinomycetota bacterium]MCG2803727.1 protein-glutamate O-methyltransferase CheR [Cellulomonas sp.]
MSVEAAGTREITAAQFARIAELQYAHTGIRLGHGKESLVMSRLDRRLRLLGLDGYDAYLAYLGEPGHGGEVRRVVDLLTTNETSFFREPAHFDFLRDVAVPRHTERRPFRLWSAASSSGEEAYSAAMVLAQALGRRDWEIVGTDVSSQVVETCVRGLYPVEVAEKIPRDLLRTYCRRGRDEYAGQLRVSHLLREHMTFVCANLLGELPALGLFDVILLRNVMIYFDAETKTRLVQRLQTMLRPGGHLIIGHAETLNGIPSSLLLVEPSIHRLPGPDDV